MALTLTFNQPGIAAGDLDRGRTDILTTDAGGGRAPLISIEIGDVPPGSVVLVQALDEPPSSSPLLTQVSDALWTLEFNAGAWGPFRIQATASIGTEVVSSVTRRISVRSPTFHLAYPSLSERYDPNAHLVPTVPSVQLTEMNEHSTNRALVDFHREVVQAIDTLSAGGIDSIPDGSITEPKLDPAYSSTIVLTDGSHPMLAELDMSGSRIVDVGQPTLPTDAARLADADYTAGAGLLRTDHTLDVVAHADGSIIVGTDSVQVGVLATDTQHGTRGGGTQHATVIAAGAAGFMSGADKTKLNGIAAGADVTTVALAAATAPLSVNSQRITNLGAPLAPTDAARVQDLIDATVVAGAGLVRAGTTLNVAADADASIVVAADSLKVGVLATDAQHGTRGGGTQHATVTTTTPGFASAADKTKLDGISAGADVTTVALAAATAPLSVNGQRITNLGTPTAATDAATRAYVDAAPPVLHSSTHADGGADEINVAGLSGLLADPQTAGGLKTATTTVAIAAAAAPAVDTALMANSSTAAAWRVPPSATTSAPGYMSAADKLKLDGVASSAAAVGSAAASQVTVTTAGPGSAATAARSDHVHSVATAAPSALTVGGAQAPGSSASLARADHVHAMPALVTTSVDGFMLAADKSKLDGVEAGAQVTSFARVQTALAAASSAVSINAQRLTSVADPSAAQDAATKAYVDALAQGLDVKASVRLVATTNVASLSGNVSIDGSTTAPAQRVLLVGQTAASANGIYLTAAGAWSRTTDADTSAKVTSGMYVFVTEGTANADSGWALITPDPIVLGTTALTFSQVTGAGQITAGAGLTKTSNTIDVVAHADGSIVVNADSVQLGVIATDAQHGVRAGGTTHAAVIAAGASGFMTGTDKSRLDSLVASYKTAVRVASVAHIPNVDIAGNQPAVVDGISLAVGDRILVKDQNPTFQTNNIYSVTTVGTGSNGVWAKAADADATGELVTGSIVYVAEGTQAGQWWQLSTLGTITVGTTAQAWVRQTLLLSSTAPAAVGNVAAAVGVGTTAARQDHTHLVSSGTPVALTLAGSTAAGSATTLALSDHVHALPATAAAVSLTVAGANSAGTAATLARSDHVHALPDAASVAYVDALPIKKACRVVHTATTAHSGLLTIDGITVSSGDRVLSVGQLSWQSNGIYIAAAGAWARATDADTSAELPPSMLVPVGPEGTTYANTLWQMRAAAPVNLGTTTLQFTLVSGVLASATSPNVTAAAAAVGTAQTVARQDHTHQVTAGSPVALTLVAATADGTSNSLARADHVHALPATASPAALTVGAASAPGSAVTLPRSDHVHAMPGVATTGAAGFMSAADKTKLDGISTSAAALASTAPLENTGLAAVGVGTTAARADHQHPISWKAPVAAFMSTETFNPAAPDSVVDGVTLVAGDRVLVQDIITAANCGIWLVGASTWTLVETLQPGEVVYNESRANEYAGGATPEAFFELYPLANGARAGLMSTTDYTKLVGIATGAAAVTSSAPTQITVTTAAAGSSSSAARGDHVHSVSTASPTALTVGGSTNLGSNTSLARSDHVHAMPNVATTGAAGFMSAADKARVDVGALPYSASVAANTWTIANSAGTKTLPSPAVLGDTVVIVVTNSGVNIAAGSGNTIIDANSSGYSTISSVPYPAAYTFRCAVAGFWFMGDNLASASSPALPGLMLASDKSKLNGITAGADPTLATLSGAAGPVSINSQRLTNVAAPTASVDAVNKLYIDNILLAMPRTNGCRLSGHAGNAVMPADNATCTTLYFHPHVSDIIWLYVNATQWLPCRVPSGGLSLALSGLTVGRPYDVFIVAPTTWSPAAATYTIELQAWTSTVTRAAALQNQGGFYTLGSDPTRRYVGTIYARAANSFAWVRAGYTTTTAKCDLWNADNRVEGVFWHETAWTGSIATASANTWFMATASHKFEFMQGIATIEPLNASMQIGVNTVGTANQGYCGIALNSTTPVHGGRAITASGEVTVAHSELYDVSPQGANYLQFMLLGTATSVLFYTTDDPAGAIPIYWADARTRFMY